MMGIGGRLKAAAAGNTHSIDLELASTQQLTADDSASLSITGDMTIECWVKIESQPANNKSLTIVSKTDSDTQRSYRFFNENLAGTVSLALGISSDGSAQTVKRVTYTITTATWTHLAVVYTAAGGTIDFYVNGAQQGTQQSGAPTSIFDGTALLSIGANNDGGEDHFDGLIDDVRIWATTRTEAQINDNKSLEIDSAASLNGSWHLNNVLTDSSGNSNTLTNVNSATFTTDVPFS